MGNLHDTGPIKRSLNRISLSRNSKHIAIHLRPIPSLTILIILIDNLFVPRNIRERAALLMNTSNCMTKLMDHYSTELFICSLVVKPAEIHGWFCLGYAPRTSSDIGPGPARIAGDPNIGVSRGDKFESEVSEFRPNVGKLLDFGVDKVCCSVWQLVE
jgi:hypothetical protein